MPKDDFCSIEASTLQSPRILSSPLFEIDVRQIIGNYIEGPGSFEDCPCIQ